jgi:thioredoxin
MTEHRTPGPTRDEIDASTGAIVLEFGTGWCGFCQAAAPLVAAATKNASTVQHIKVEDGPGRPLGRSFRVKLWPTLIFLKDGVEIERLVRPQSAAEIAAALERLSV